MSSKEATFVVVCFKLLKEKMFHVSSTTNLETNFLFFVDNFAPKIRPRIRNEIQVELNLIKIKQSKAGVLPGLVVSIAMLCASFSYGKFPEEHGFDGDLPAKFDSTKTSLSMRSLLFGLPAVVYKCANVIWPELVYREYSYNRL